jgi:lysozyme
MLLGIDVSDFQGKINWPAVAKAGCTYGFAKATEGATLVSDTFAANWAGMKAAGLKRGAYHFFHAAKDPIVQANLFIKTVPFQPGDLPPVLDVETAEGVGSADLSKRILQWLNTVQVATKRQPIIYTSYNFWHDNLNNSDGFRGHPLWIAQYEVDQPELPGNWDQWTFWQYSEAGTIAGVAGPVDVNKFNGPIAALNDLAQGYFWLMQGNHGPRVAALQQKLRAQGFDPGAADGKFGPATKTAIVALQKAKKLPLTGVADAATQKVLLA